MLFLVVYDDGESLCIPMGKDIECEGALCISSETAALFSSRESAKKAIKISRLFAELRQAQGKPANEDFLSGYKSVRIMKVESILSTKEKP